MRAILAASTIAALALQTTAAPGVAEYRLAPFKDELFQYRNILENGFDGDYLKVEYSRQRDLYDRDVEERLKVHPKYVSLDTQEVEGAFTVRVGQRTIRYIGVGRTEGNAKAIVIFVHGAGTDGAAGVNDWIHGGNFNRLKNLMMLNDGVYLSPDFSDFRRRGAEEIESLLLFQGTMSPEAPIFLACASMGGHICWRLAKNRDTARLITGLVFLDAPVDDGYLKTAAALPPSERPAIQMSNSGGDWLIGWRSQLSFFKRMKATVPDYPIRFVLFDAGTHGISLRMIDWRQVLNWMLEVRDR